MLKVFFWNVCSIMIQKLYIAYTELTLDYSLHRCFLKLFILSDNAM